MSKKELLLKSLLDNGVDKLMIETLSLGMEMVGESDSLIDQLYDEYTKSPYNALIGMGMLISTIMEKVKREMGSMVESMMKDTLDAMKN